MPSGQPIQPLTDAKYGENTQYEASQRVMPMEQAQAAPPAPTPTDIGGVSDPGSAPMAPPDPLGDFMGPSTRPGEPVTAGAPMGAGPNQMRLGPQAPIAPGSLSATLAEYGAADSTGIIAEIAQFFDGMNI
jgi:hypothetical protein